MCSPSMQREINVSQKISKQQTHSACFKNVMKLRQIGRGNVPLRYASFAVCSHYLQGYFLFKINILAILKSQNEKPQLLSLTNKKGQH